MGNNFPSLDDPLITLLQVLREDKKLELWFLAVEGVPRNLRVSELLKLSAFVRKTDPRLAETLERLTDPRLFKAFYRTLQELKRA
jgi:hypothetical protein